MINQSQAPSDPNKSAEEVFSLHSKSTTSGVHKDASLNPISNETSAVAPSSVVQGSRPSSSVAEILKDLRSSYSMPSSPTSLNSSMFQTELSHLVENVLKDVHMSTFVPQQPNRTRNSHELSHQKDSDAEMNNQHEDEHQSITSTSTYSLADGRRVYPVSTNTSTANIDHLVRMHPLSADTSSVASSLADNASHRAKTVESTSFHEYLESVNAYLAAHNN